MKIWTDKEGNKLDGKQFIEKWKAGIQKITPIQQLKSQLTFSWLMLIGFIAGIVVISVTSVSKLWWALIILVAGLGNTIVQHITIYSKYKMYIQIEEQMKGGYENEQQSTT